ncbi:MAG: CoA protein activase [Clostridia bacterium]|nr:CoA protein activase [Clostridia bacterium]
MKVTFPHMGNTYICAKALMDDFGIDYVIPPFNSKKTLEIGTKYAPELACLPLKINIGNFVQAHRQGADTMIITGGCGPCRFGYYSEMNREILKDIGCELDVIALEWPDQGLPEFLRRVKKLTGGLNVVKISRVLKDVTQIAKMMDDFERLSFRVRPREVHKGDTDRIYKAFLNKVLKTAGSSEIKKLIRDATSELLSIDMDRDFVPLKVGIVGEIYTTIDPFTNNNIASKLGNMGIEVDRQVTVSGWIIEHIIKNALHLPRDLRYAEAARPYLGTMIGGHAQETLGHTVLYAKEGYDGVIQVYPLTCMPEIVAESILPAVERDYDISVLTLIIDEMTGEAGYDTRIEAFVDLLKRRRERKNVGEATVLFGN